MAICPIKLTRAGPIGDLADLDTCICIYSNLFVFFVSYPLKKATLIQQQVSREVRVTDFCPCTHLEPYTKEKKWKEGRDGEKLVHVHRYAKTNCARRSLALVATPGCSCARISRRCSAQRQTIGGRQELSLVLNAGAAMSLGHRARLLLTTLIATPLVQTDRTAAVYAGV